ncbi:MAG: glycerol kinase [Chloroflexi bacterium RBG_13_51_36]|nr:MAG: glycerol kinase [Chloroflexi bacterium RBG_13_51_36]
MRNYILAIDQGTTGTTALVVDRDGIIRGRGYAKIPQYYPEPGWVEHDPSEIWEQTLQAVNQAKHAAGIADVDIAAIGITNQRETTILVDKVTGEPVGRAIVWQCRRTADRCEQLKAQGMAEIIQAKTGLVIDAYFSATKIQWLLENLVGLRERAERGEILFCNVDAWLLWKLTNGRVHATDFSNASRTMLFNINALDWDDELLRLFNIPRPMLPEVHPSINIFGYTKEGIPIAGVAGDQQAALFGQACYRPGMTKVTYGTGAFVLMNIGKKPVAARHGLLTTFACNPDGKAAYALEGSVFIAGAAIQWLQDLGLIKEAVESEQLSTAIKNTGGVYLVPAFVGLGTPHWDMYARGALVGLTRGSGKAQVVRAAVESIAYQVTDVLEAMVADSGLRLAEIRVDGGAATNNFLAQFQADIAGVEVSRPKMLETTALGAAYLAGLGIGFWKSGREIELLREVGQRFMPCMEITERQALRCGWARALERAKGWLIVEE